jgi:hypothetical protein
VEDPWFTTGSPVSSTNNSSNMEEEEFEDTKGVNWDQFGALAMDTQREVCLNVLSDLDSRNYI